MVHLMGSLHSENHEDFPPEEEYGSLPKRTRFEAAPSNQLSYGNNVANVAAPQYNPLDEPSPLGLRLKKSLSLLDLIQMTLSQRSSGLISSNPTEVACQENKKDATDKLKASNFPALSLRIGSWEYVSKYEGDLVAKCYFAKQKLVWEVLDAGLKSKIEIQWSDIIALKADLPDDAPGALTIVLARQPVFFRETNPQPRKHTLWQATTDFTDGQASTNKQHFLECPPGMLNKHYEKLIQCDTRLSSLSQQPEIVVDTPYFKSQASVCESSEESRRNQPAKEEVASLSPLPFQEASPSSVMDMQAIEVITKSSKHDLGGANIPWLGPSMSMSDIVNHIGSCKDSECDDMLENISEALLSDTHFSAGLDERSLMKKVNSLCNLLHDPPVAPSNNHNEVAARNVCIDLVSDDDDSTDENSSTAHFEGGLPRKDSFSDLLLHLPRVASLPKFSNLYGIAEDDDFFSP